jgi:DNA polymerase-1
MPVLISTGDKDMAQLVNDHITLINTMSGTVLDSDGVEEKFGVPPSRIIDLLALMGDSSDNIPGIPKVGPKTAAKWLQQYGSLDEVIAHAEEIKGKVGESLREHMPSLDLSYKLATIRCDVPLDVEANALNLQKPDQASLREWYQRLEFKSWLTDMGDGDESHTSRAKDETTADYQIVLDQKTLQSWLQRLQKAETFAFDTETTSLNYMQAKIVGVSFAVQSGEAAYVPLAHDYPGAPEQLDRDAVLGQLRPILEDPQQPKIGHNLKYDMSVLANHNIELAGIGHDTMLESYVLNSTGSRHNMDSLALKYLDHKNISFEEVAGKGVKQVTFNQVDLEQAGPYAAEDADITLRLHENLWPSLKEHAGLVRVYSELEIPLVPVLSRMERIGVCIDTDMLQRQSADLALRIQEIEEQSFEVAGQSFNLSSPKQIQEILYEKLGLPMGGKTKKGAPSTAESVLQELALDYPLPRLILDYRSLSKLKSTYTDRLPEQINPDTGRVHTSYHQAVAATGRLSSSDPNLQNIPVRTEEGRRIRQAFVASPGYRILAADYSQIELRIMAHLSGDKRLLEAFAAGEDIHQATAAEVFGVQPEKVTSDQRRSAKAINFGLIYGMSAFGLARQLGIQRGAAQEYVDRYFARYPGVKAYMDGTRAKAHDMGYVETLFGRRLYLPEINARNGQRRNAAERTAINAPMQGTAADIIKRAMIRADQWIRESGLEVKMIMQVHDELVFEIKDTQLDQATGQITRTMEAAAELSTPLLVGIGVGDNWDQAH